MPEVVFIPYCNLKEHSFGYRKKADYPFRSECGEGAISDEQLLFSEPSECPKYAPDLVAGTRRQYFEEIKNRKINR
ncbi:MAG: hypothetical protein E7473_03660 [Ruminococcaceae bacterium]|nr:hypothetical protein [Oscillospiraceae bacterium]